MSEGFAVFLVMSIMFVVSKIYWKQGIRRGVAFCLENMQKDHANELKRKLGVENGK